MIKRIKLSIESDGELRGLSDLHYLIYVLQYIYKSNKLFFKNIPASDSLFTVHLSSISMQTV